MSLDLTAWLATVPAETLINAEAAPDTDTPTALLRVVRVRPPFERATRLLIVDVLRLPGAERWAAA